MRGDSGREIVYLLTEQEGQMSKPPCDARFITQTRGVEAENGGTVERDNLAGRS